jgi:predicted DNA binding CopG/RHH family protein
MQKPRIIENAPYLDDEERELIEEIEARAEAGLLVDTLTLERKAELEAAARATINPPKKPITTRLSVHDLSKLKVRAMQLGIPYQTLLASIVHQYVEGRLVEKN